MLRVLEEVRLQERVQGEQGAPLAQAGPLPTEADLKHLDHQLDLPDAAHPSFTWRDVSARWATFRSIWTLHLPDLVRGRPRRRDAPNTKARDRSQEAGAEVAIPRHRPGLEQGQPLPGGAPRPVVGRERAASDRATAPARPSGRRRRSTR